MSEVLSAEGIRDSLLLGLDKSTDAHELPASGKKESMKACMSEVTNC